MSVTARSHHAAETTPDLDVIMSDLASLKRDFVTLTDHVKTGAINGAARDAVGQLGDEAKRLYGNLAAQGERSMNAIGHQVEERPVMSLLLAFALGFIGSRLLSR
jgi:hypothetical protein